MAQHAELQAIILAVRILFMFLLICIQIVHVHGVLMTIETVYIGPANDEQLFHLFHELRALLQQHKHPYFEGHLWSHSGFPGPLLEGN
jgi:hypothetical protein